ncbi:MAG: hypothetical protein VKP62_14650 [Candidatus Sericytochromatia bacterium]|nr:hypothetical protein [Candidatus Sericytochromatia bacterium]
MKLHQGLQTCLGGLLYLALTACDATDAPLALAANTSRNSATQLQIRDLTMPSIRFTAGELFELHFRVVIQGAGAAKAYGIATRLGTQEYPFPEPLPIVPNGRVMLLKAGPLPNQNENGRFDVEFWLIDVLGRNSNRLKTSIQVQ